MRGKFVFIAGPIRGTGNPAQKAQNIKQAMDTATELILAGHYPYCPHLSFFLNKNRRLPRAMWLTLSTAWIDRSDVVLRIPGFSEGADDEVSYALQHGMMLFYDVPSFLAAFQKGKVYRFRPVEVPTRDQRTPMWTKGDQFPGMLYGYPIIWNENMEAMSSPVWMLQPREAPFTLKRTMSGSVEDQQGSGYSWEGKPDEPREQYWNKLRDRLGVSKVVNTAATPTVCSTCGVVNCNLIGQRKEGAECFGWMERRPSVEWEILKEGWKRSNEAHPRTATLCAVDAAGVELIRDNRELKTEIEQLQGALKVEQDMCMTSSACMDDLRKELGMLTGELVLEKKMREAETMLRKEFDRCATDLTTDLHEMTEGRDSCRQDYNQLVIELNKTTGELTQARSALLSAIEERNQAIEERKDITFVYKDSSEVEKLKAERDLVTERGNELFLANKRQAIEIRRLEKVEAEFKRYKELIGFYGSAEKYDELVSERDKLLESITCGNRIEMERIHTDVQRLRKVMAERDAAQLRTAAVMVERDEFRQQFADADKLRADATRERDQWCADATTITRQRDSAVTQREGARKALENATHEVMRLNNALIMSDDHLKTARYTRDGALKHACRRICPFRRR